MDFDLELIELFKEFYEKQDMAQKRTSRAAIDDYGHSELHCLEEIGAREKPNVSRLAETLALTRGAVSKIVKKLINRGDISSFQSLDNKKEIYYRLTDRGRRAAEAHQRRRRLWLERDLGFLRAVKDEDKAVVARFLRQFNKYLLARVEEGPAGAARASGLEARAFYNLSVFNKL